MAQQTILLVGGAGYIGSYLNKRLFQEGFRTIILDNLSTGCKENVRWGSCIIGDLGDAQILKQLFQNEKIDAVVHLAAHLSVGESVSHPSKYYRNNVTNTLILLDQMRAFGIQNFLFSSSAAVYGSPRVIPIREEHPCAPLNPYGETKWMVEKMLRDYNTAYGLKSTALRYFNAAGADPDGDIQVNYTLSTNLIPAIFKTLDGQQPALQIFGTDYNTPDGTCIRDYIHIHDLAEAHILALQQMLAKNELCTVYNLGIGKGFSVREVIDTAQRIIGQPIFVEECRRRAGDPAMLLADASKARSALGWKPRYTNLEEMVKHAWEAFPTPQKMALA